MWDIKDIMLFICSVLVVILISVKTAGANPITDWFETEKQIEDEITDMSAYEESDKGQTLEEKVEAMV